VDKLRANELKYLTYLAYVSAVGFSLIMLSAPIIQLILVFFTYVQIQEQPLTASVAFTTVALFNIMRFPFAFLPMGMLQYIQSKVSLRQLARYLQLPELEKYVNYDVSDNNGTLSKSVGSITIQNGTFSWTNKGANLQPIGGEDDKKNGKMKSNARSSKTGSNDLKKSLKGINIEATKVEESESIDIHTLRNINLSIKPGELIAVVGSV